MEFERENVSWTWEEKLFTSPRNISFSKGKCFFFFLCDAHLPPAFKGIKKKGKCYYYCVTSIEPIAFWFFFFFSLLLSNDVRDPLSNWQLFFFGLSLSTVSWASTPFAIRFTCCYPPRPISAPFSNAVTVEYRINEWTFLRYGWKAHRKLAMVGRAPKNKTVPWLRFSIIRCVCLYMRHCVFLFFD